MIRHAYRKLQAVLGHSPSCSPVAIQPGRLLEPTPALVEDQKCSLPLPSTTAGSISHNHLPGGKVPSTRLGRDSSGTVLIFPKADRRLLGHFNCQDSDKVRVMLMNLNIQFDLSVIAALLQKVKLE